MMRRYFLFYTNRFCWGAWIWMCVVNHIAFCFSPSTYLLHTPWIGKQPRYTYTQIDRDVFCVRCSLAFGAQHKHVHMNIWCVCAHQGERAQPTNRRTRKVWVNKCVCDVRSIILSPLRKHWQWAN